MQKQYYKFIFHLESDGNKKHLEVRTDTDIQSAIDKVLNQELAPFSAITSIDIIPVNLYSKEDGLIEENQVDKAKRILSEKGFYTDSLWSIDDVKDKFECSDEEAYLILDRALTNDATMEQIWFAIGMYKEYLKEEKNGN